MSAVKGFTKCPNDILFSRKLTPNAKLLYTSLNFWDRGHGRGCFASKATISSMVGLSLFQVRNALRELAEELLITIEKRGQGKTDVIFLTSRPEVSSTLPSIIEEEEVKEEELPNKPLEKVKTTETTSPHPPQSTLTIRPIPKCLEETTRLLRSIKDAMRPQTYSVWFEDKVCVSYENEKRVELSCVDEFSKNWIEENYSTLLERVSGKNVSFVVIYRRSENGPYE